MTATPAPDPLAEDLRAAIGHFVRHARAHDGTGGRASVLGYLARDGGCSIAELAAREQVRHQSMARTVKNLQAQGHVTVHTDPTDGRRVVVEVTPAGRDHLQAERARRAAWIATAIATRLDDAERARLRDVPGLLRKLMEP